MRAPSPLLGVGARLQRVELRVEPAPSHEFVVASHLKYASFVEHYDQIRHPHRREAVRHDQRHRAAIRGRLLCEPLEQGVLGRRINCRRWFIEDGWISGGRKPRGYCLITRQRTGQMIESLASELESRNIRLRDESRLQDLLVEPASEILLSVLLLSTRNRGPAAWDVLNRMVARVLGPGVDGGTGEVERRCELLLQHARDFIGGRRGISALPGDLVDEIGSDSIRSAFGQYRQGSFLQTVTAQLTDELSSVVAASASLRVAVEDLVGLNTIPVMTIHKSKGLEFQTVIFLGLEDSQWWAFAQQLDEEKRAFFIAFSRTVSAVYFTYCDVRDERWGRRRQRRNGIDDLYEVLDRAGIRREDLRR